MNVGAINSVNFTARKHKEEDKQQKAIELFDKLEGTFVNSNDIKTPGAVVASVGCAGGKTFVKGAGVALLLDKATGDRASAAFEKGLKAVSKFAKSTSAKLIKEDAKGIKKVGNFLGSNLNKLEGFAKNIYKSMAKNNAGKGMAMVAGFTSALGMVPQILKRDGNKDGIADISQKSQNAYATKSAELDRFSEGINIASEIIATLA